MQVKYVDTRSYIYHKQGHNNVCKVKSQNNFKNRE